MTECIFCAIAAGDAPAATIRKDDRTMAFLDANPLAPGHTLVIPNAHAERLEDLDTETARAVMDRLRELAPAIEAAVDADATTVGFNNGRAAGQEVPHVHGHIIPRFDGDGGGPIHAVLPRGADRNAGDPEAIARAINDHLRD
ncbi:HIT family protein [Halodesulfurarchaeum sp. HSR-GB]|uniref:HIT family protein n=1 Tax=Halodesulfurarchaeum sp. HSR-GB TaxID=3074077 RepID=UPI00286199DE|nr:HIT family protein [Halodesulfurarchaeum sp. HSR-GB]MDR5656059.1 HIT family protein [Halodesulfurarchaeum sp. HSR-GB]